jgi:adenylate kinase family enzyme
MGRRIAVIGASGNGKTTVARALAARFGAPHVELDALHHGPNWSAPSAEEFRAVVEPHLERDAWVVDGDYTSKLGDLVFERADTVVWLDQPLPLILWRLWRRTLRRIRRAEELWNGNRESWRGAFWGRESLFVWTIRSYFRKRRTLPARLARQPQLQVVRLRSTAAVARFLESIEPEVPGRRAGPPARASAGRAG